MELAAVYQQKIRYRFSYSNCQSFVWYLLFCHVQQNCKGIVETNRCHVCEPVQQLAAKGFEKWKQASVKEPTTQIDMSIKRTHALEGEEAEYCLMDGDLDDDEDLDNSPVDDITYNRVPASSLPQPGLTPLGYSLVAVGIAAAVLGMIVWLRQAKR